MRKLSTIFSILLFFSLMVTYDVEASTDANEDYSTQENEDNFVENKDESTKNEQQTGEESEDEKDINTESDLESPENSNEDIVEEEQRDSYDENESESDESNAEKDKSIDTEDDEQSNEDKMETKEDSQKAKTQTFSATAVEEGISRLGHIRRANVKIYDDLTLTSSFQAGTDYTNKVYYIKKQADVGDQRYYLISTKASSTSGTVGWVKSEDLSTHTHKGVDKDSKVFQIKGTGSAYQNAWGGSKDLVYNLSDYEGETFSVHLTEKVGNNTWYRGSTLGGKTVWIHESYLDTIEESKTSRLGHIRRANVEIYDDLTLTSSFQAGSDYTNKVYYIKKQADVGDQRYYLISTKASSTSGTVGWVKSEELSTHTHKGVDKDSKVFQIKGTGSAYQNAWGGSKDLVYNLSDYEGATFSVHLTEKVGNNTWYRGKLDGETVWIHESYLDTIEESKTSRLGHIRRTNVEIYDDLSLTSSFQAGSDYTNKVYYIKKQADVGEQRYYLISTKPSSTSGTVGWVKSEDLSTHTHKGVDKDSRVLHINGTGNAYQDAWGGSKDLVYNLSDYEGATFSVHLTEKVGNNTWYRGKLDGKTVWIHESYLDTIEESKTSRLGHIRRSNVEIYDDLSLTSSFQAGSTYTHKVYYIKKQADVGEQRYYLISTKPSSTSGTVGWVKSEDLSTHTHKGVDKDSKVLHIKGTGNAYQDAWGGSKDLVYNLSEYEGATFSVHLTEKVGNNTWYRGKLDGKTVWIHESYLTAASHTAYDITLNRALEIQMTATPQTDENYAYVSKTYIDANGRVTADVLNVRKGAGTTYKIVGQLYNGDKVNIISEYNGWYVIDFNGSDQWVNARPEDVKYYLDPNNFIEDDKQQFQFLDLSLRSGASKTVLNDYLKGKGILEGRAQAFIDASLENNINDVYLISHATLETGNGGSELANGIEVGKNKSGNLVLVTSGNRSNLTDIKKVYNMYGIGAYDNCARECGAKRAYEEGWTTPDKAIIGGAKFIDNYINRGQNTLYKMRWDPAAMEATGTFGYQYATDIGWASKQINTMYNLYQSIGSYTLQLDIPEYK